MTVSTGEASLVADLAERTGLDLPPVPDAARDAILRDLPTMGYIGNPLDPWGAADAPIAYRACFEALAASGAYDVLAVVHDSPFRDLPCEVEVARDVSDGADRGHRRPAVPAAGLRVADVRRRHRAGQGDARRGRRDADAPRGHRGVRRDRAPGAVGAADATRLATGPAGPAGRRSPRTGWRGAPTPPWTR